MTTRTLGHRDSTREERAARLPIASLETMLNAEGTRFTYVFTNNLTIMLEVHSL